MRTAFSRVITQRVVVIPYLRFGTTYRLALAGGTDSTSQQDFGTRKVYCVSNVTFHAESKYAIKIFPSPTVFVQWPS